MEVFWRMYLKIAGWDTTVQFPYHDLKKYIIIVGPHTSNWDFIIGLAYRSMLRLTYSRFLGKKELFTPPFGFFFRWLGGIPVDRHNKNHMVDDVVNQFGKREHLVVALSPEGTRTRVERLRTGFYFIALRAQVPIVMVGLDWKYRTIRLGAPFIPRDQAEDFAHILNFYSTIEGRYPENGLMDQ
jgi:1-acyl-sn-glycerol-3-phosphate acyltransferase